MGREVLSRGWDLSGHLPRGLRRVGGSFGRSETGGEVHRKVWDGSGNPPSGLEWVGRSSRRSRPG